MPPTPISTAPNTARQIVEVLVTSLKGSQEAFGCSKSHRRRLDYVVFRNGVPVRLQADPLSGEFTRPQVS
jgi:hypothetical protein